MSNFNNPAGRLFNLFEYIKNNTTTTNAGSNISDMMVDYLNVGGSLYPEYFQGIGGILELPHLLAQRIEALEDPIISKDVLMRPVEPANQVVTKIAMGIIITRSVDNLITKQLMDDLNIDNSVLGRTKPGSILDDQSLSRVGEIADEIIDHLNKSVYDEKIKELILDHARSIRIAATEVQVYGPEYLVRERDRMVGAFMRRGDVMEAISKDEPLKNRIMELLNYINITTSVLAFPLTVSANIIAILNGNGG